MGEDTEQEGRDAIRAGEDIGPYIATSFLCLEQALACLCRREEEYQLPIDNTS